MVSDGGQRVNCMTVPLLLPGLLHRGHPLTPQFACSAVSSPLSAPRIANHRHGPSLPLPRQRAGWELSYNRRSPGACCQTAWRRLVLGRWPKSTLDIVVEPALGDAVPTIGCDLARSRRPSAGPSGPVVKPLLRSPTKTGRKSHVKAVLSSGLADTRAAPSGRKRPLNPMYVHRTANVAMRGHDFTAKFTTRFGQQENPQFGGGRRHRH